MSRTRLIGSRSAIGARERVGWKFIGRSKWFFSASGTILVGLAHLDHLRIAQRRRRDLVDGLAQFWLVDLLDLCVAEPRGARVSRTWSTSAGRSIGVLILVPDSKSMPNWIPSPAMASAPADYGVNTADFTVNSIGPTFGDQIARTALIAISASLLLISIYIALRFEAKFAVPVLIAVAHDILITGGVYALLGREVTTSTVAALLTILGYSLYDTIIVFDRIRENVPRMPRATFSQIVNRSMSEVFTRSLATSFSTLMPVSALLLFGGETLRDFAFALLVGIGLGRVLVDLHRLARAHPVEGA